MIEVVLVIGQGPNDIGFLEGLRDRLGCFAQLVNFENEPRLRRRGTWTRKKEAKLILKTCLQKYRLDLIVSLTDGDASKWQHVRQEEHDRWPAEWQSMLVCGVCDRDVEHWITLDPIYAGQVCGFERSELPPDRKDRSRFVKRRIQRRLLPGQTYTEFLADFVRKAPTSTIRSWLADPAFGAFYQDCLAAAARHQCRVKNELN